MTQLNIRISRLRLAVNIVVLALIWWGSSDVWSDYGADDGWWPATRDNPILVTLVIVSGSMALMLIGSWIEAERRAGREEVYDVLERQSRTTYTIDHGISTKRQPQ